MMQPEQAKNVFKQIFSDGWAAFLRQYPRYVAVDEVVQKMLAACRREAGELAFVEHAMVLSTTRVTK